MTNNRIKSNSLKINLIEENNGINYSITSLDSVNNNRVYFTAAKIDRHHVFSSKLSSLTKLKCKWELNTNLIVIIKELKNTEWKKYVEKLFYSNDKFKLNDLLTNDFIENDGQSKFEFIPGENWFYQIVKQDTIIYESLHDAPLIGLRSIKQKKVLISYAKDGSIKFWNYNGDYLATLYMSGQYNFVYFNPNNYYYASKEILSKIGFQYRGELFSYEQYDLFFNRPDLVLNSLKMIHSENILLFKKAYFKRLERLGVKNNVFEITKDIPSIFINYNNEYSTKTEFVTFNLKAESKHLKIKSYSYIINGIEKKFTLDKLINDFQTIVPIELSIGINQIEFFCRNEKDIKSTIHKEIITCVRNKEKPNLYLVSIGLSQYKNNKYNLSYANKDANEIAQMFNNQKRYKKVFKKLYFDSSATKSNLKSMDSFLSQAKINDVIIIFYAGHGILDEKLDYYLATYDMDFKNPGVKGFKFDDFETIIENQKCRNKLVFIDACYSGEIDKENIAIKSSDLEKIEDIKFRSAGVLIEQKNDGIEMGILELSKLLFVDMRLSQGTNIISSASGAEFAFEGDKWKNGLFTHVLKNGLLNYAADLNGDKQIRLSELQLYLRDEVSNLSHGKQNPLSRKENIKNNFVIW